MAREFSFITVSDIVRQVREEGVPRFSRSTFYRLIKREKWPIPARTSAGDGKGWRSFGSKDPKTEEDRRNISAYYYIALIKHHYNKNIPIPERPEGLIEYDDAIGQDII